MKLGYALVAATSIAFAGPAAAATVTVLGPVTSQFANTAPVSTTGTVDLDVTGTIPNVYTSVYTGTGFEAFGIYNSVQTGGSATYDLSGMAGSTFKLIWGTVDSFNTLTLNGMMGDSESEDALFGMMSESITGADVLAAAMGTLTEAVSNVLVEITADYDFYSVTLTSDGQSFEHVFDPAPVPVPAAGLLLLTAVGGLGFAARRRKSV